MVTASLPLSLQGKAPTKKSPNAAPGRGIALGDWEF